MADLKKAFTLRFWVHMILLAAVFILVSQLLAGVAIVFTLKGLLMTTLILGIASIALEFILDAVGLKK